MDRPKAKLRGEIQASALRKRGTCIFERNSEEGFFHADWIKVILMNSASAVLCYALVGLVASDLGQLPALVEILLLVPAVALLVWRERDHELQTWPALVLLGVLLPIFPLGSSRWAGFWMLILTLSGWLWVNSHLLGRKENPTATVSSWRSRLRLFGFFIGVLGVLLLLDVSVFANPRIRHMLDETIRPVSVALTSLRGEPGLPLGTTYWSPFLLVTYLLFGLLKPSWRERAFHWVAGAGALVGYLALVGFLHRYASQFPEAQYRSLAPWYVRSGTFQLAAEPITIPYLLHLVASEHCQIVLLIFLALAHAGVSLFAATKDRAPLDVAPNLPAKPGFRRLLLFAGSGGVAGLLLLWSTLPPRHEQSDLDGRKAAVFTSCIRMDVPVHGSYGDKSLGMFGLLPTELRALGFEVDEIASVDELCPEHDLLFLINLQDQFSERHKQAILDWVRAGGGLLILTDHTGDKGLRLPVNDLTREFGLEVGFDTAKFFSSDGSIGVESLIGSLANRSEHLLWRGGIGYGTGASISIERDAVPVLQIKHGYMEYGSFTATSMGQLGNLKYDPGERAGDIVVAGLVNVGKGRIVVFGDTSPLQNGAFDSDREFLVQTLGTVLRPEEQIGIGFPMALGIGACALLLAALLLSGRSETRTGASVFVFVQTGAWALGWVLLTGPPKPVALKEGRVAIIDNSHCPYIGNQSWTATDVGGLMANMMRDKFRVVFNDSDLQVRLASAAKGDYLFLVCPLLDFSSEELASMDAFLARGGGIIVNCGYEHSRAIRKFLDRYNLRITDIPLGSTPVEETLPDSAHVHLLDGWEVEGDGDGEVLHSLRGRPVALRKSVQGGTLSLIGDSKFFWNANLEDRSNHRPGNIGFLRALTDTAEKEGMAASIIPEEKKAQ